MYSLFLLGAQHIKIEWKKSDINRLRLESGYFDVNGILPLKIIFPYSFMCVYIAIIATVLSVMLWHMDSASVLK